MELATALAFARQHHNGVLTTTKRDGRPQLSNITYRVTDDGLVEISITADRAKHPNLMRDPRASVHVTREDFYAYAVIEGDAELLPVAAAPTTRRSRRSSTCTGRSSVSTQTGTTTAPPWCATGARSCGSRRHTSTGCCPRPDGGCGVSDPHR